jgi:hypothetical protein
MNDGEGADVEEVLESELRSKERIRMGVLTRE